MMMYCSSPLEDNRALIGSPTGVGDGEAVQGRPMEIWWRAQFRLEKGQARAGLKG